MPLVKETKPIIWYIYENYKKISKILWIKFILRNCNWLQLRPPSRRLWNLQQTFLTVPVFKLVYAAIILVFSLSLILNRVLLLSWSTPHTHTHIIMKAISIKGVAGPEVRGMWSPKFLILLRAGVSSGSHSLDSRQHYHLLVQAVGLCVKSVVI